MQNEKLVAPADDHNTMGQFTPSVHGFNSSVQVSFPGFPIPLNERVIATRQEMAAEFPFNWDMNNGDVLGICVPRYTSTASTPLISSHILLAVGWAQATIGLGHGVLRAATQPHKPQCPHQRTSHQTHADWHTEWQTLLPLCQLCSSRGLCVLPKHN